MPIKPIDFQIMIPRTVDASKSKNDDFAKLLNVQKVTNDNIHQESEKGLKQVQHRDKPYKASIDKDGKGKKNMQDENEESSDNKKNNNEKENKDSKTGQPMVHIDIKI